MHQVVIFAFLLPCALSSIRVSSSEDENYGPAEPYNFGYKVHDEEGDQWRSEKSDGQGKVEGSYGYVDSLGLRREVHYVADDEGFRANIKTNEPGMDAPSPADIIMDANPPSDYDIGPKVAQPQSRKSNIAKEDYEAKIYGIEAFAPEMKPSVQHRVNLKMKKAVKPPKFTPPPKFMDLPSSINEKLLPRQNRFAEPSIPPIYVVDGHLQSPWFPMNSA